MQSWFRFCTLLQSATVCSWDVKIKKGEKKRNWKLKKSSDLRDEIRSEFLIFNLNYWFAIGWTITLAKYIVEAHKNNSKDFDLKTLHWTAKGFGEGVELANSV